MKFDDNIRLADDGQTTLCQHCSEPLGNATSGPLARAIRTQRPSVDAGPGIHADPKLFTDREIVLRQSLCPGCLALLATEIVPADEGQLRDWTLR